MNQPIEKQSSGGRMPPRADIQAEDAPRPMGGVTTPPAAPAPAPQAQAPVTPERKVTPISESQWSLREHKDSCHWICLPKGTPYENVFEPEFWANIVRKFRRPGESIYVTDDNMSFFAKLVLLQAKNNWAVVGQIYHVSRAEMLCGRSPSASQSRSHRVEFLGPIDLWSVVRSSDGVAIKKGFNTEDSAAIYMMDHERRIMGA